MRFLRTLPLPLAALLVGTTLVAACKEQVPIEPPKQLSESPFQYPEEMWDTGVEGETTLRIFVTERGTVDSARVEQSSGYAPFDSAAVTGAKELHFEPARQGEDSVAVWVLLPVQFDTAAANRRATPP